MLVLVFPFSKLNSQDTELHSLTAPLLPLHTEHQLYKIAVSESKSPFLQWILQIHLGSAGFPFLLNNEINFKLQ